MNSDQAPREPNRHQKRAAGSHKARYSANQVVQMMTGQAETQTDKMGLLIGSAIGMVLDRLGETQITIGPEDLSRLSKTHRVEIVPNLDPRVFTYKLIRVALDDDATAALEV